MASISDAVDSVARTMRAAGFEPLGYRRSGHAIWPIMGGDDSADAAAQAAAAADAAAAKAASDAKAAADAAKSGEKGFPEGTPLEQMSVEQREAYWKHHARKHEDAVKSMGDYQSLKDKASQYDALVAASQTEQERAVEAAKAEGRTAGKAEVTPLIVRTEIKAQAALAGMTDAAALKALTDRLDTTTFLNDKGDIDPDEVEKYVKSIVTKPAATQSVSLGQGRTRTDVKPSVANGRQLFAESRGKKPADA
jgi:hypothetical protein